MHRFRTLFKARCVLGIALGAVSICNGQDKSREIVMPIIPQVSYIKPFLPLIANPLEARIGSVIQPSNRKLRLDIGGRVELKNFNPYSEEWAAIGTEFATWTRLRSENNLKFPVETIDYWFGLYATRYIARFGDVELTTRLRVAHISSHLVDGLADTTARLNKKPFVYSREFAELLFALNYSGARLYYGITWVFSKQPKVMNAFVPQLGVEYTHRLSESFSFESGYDFKLAGVEGTYSGQHAAQVGIKYALENNTALLVAMYARSGDDMHGMYYMNKDNYLGFGFQVLW